MLKSSRGKISPPPPRGSSERDNVAHLPDPESHHRRESAGPKSKGGEQTKAALRRPRTPWDGRCLGERRRWVDRRVVVVVVVVVVVHLRRVLHLYVLFRACPRILMFAEIINPPFVTPPFAFSKLFPSGCCMRPTESPQKRGHQGADFQAADPRLPGPLPG